jgi:hypothetical protein
MPEKVGKDTRKNVAGWKKEGVKRNEGARKIVVHEKKPATRITPVKKAATLKRESIKKIVVQKKSTKKEATKVVNKLPADIILDFIQESTDISSFM